MALQSFVWFQLWLGYYIMLWLASVLATVRFWPDSCYNKSLARGLLQLVVGLIATTSRGLRLDYRALSLA
jgi:hypothetical protein